MYLLSIVICDDWSVVMLWLHVRHTHAWYGNAPWQLYAIVHDLFPFSSKATISPGASVVNGVNPHRFFTLKIR